MSEWIQHVFDEKNSVYEAVFKPNDEVTTQEVDGVIQYLDLDSESKVIDVCCGSGRHVIGLRNKGIQAFGIDISGSSITKAQLDGEKLGYNDIFFQGDIRTTEMVNSLSQSYEVAINMFNSFGYYVDDDQQRELLIGVHKLLRPEGRFLMHIPSKEFILSNFNRESTYSINGIQVVLKRNFDYKTSRLITHAHVDQYEGNPEDLVIDMRIYDDEEISDLLMHEGFEKIEIYGDFNGNKFDERSKNIVLISQKI